MLKNPDYTQQREGVKAAEKESEQLKKEGLDRLQREKEEKLEAQKKAIRDKFTMGAKDEEEMRNELMQLMQGGNGKYEEMMRQADLDKKKQNDSLEERLRKRKEANEARLAKKQAEIESELVNLDIEQVVEQEKAAEEAQERLEQDKMASTEQ